MAPKRNDAAIALGRRLRQLRELRDWTQEQLAERADIQRTYVAECEAGKRNPSLKHLDKLASAFKVRIADLFLDRYSPDRP